MGYAEYELTMPVYEPHDALRAAVAKKSGLKTFDFQILLKSLDARHKDKIVWRYRLGVSSEELPIGEAPAVQALEHVKGSRDKRIVVAGTGPAGIFAALYLARSGYAVTVLERGGPVAQRRAALQSFEAGGAFPAQNNYSFGEGGAGTFSDGKLSSRTKGIGLEREYLYNEFVAAGAPEEIRYMTHPHVGSDKLFTMTGGLRQALLDAGGTLEFEAQVEDVAIKGGRAVSVTTPRGVVEADAFLFAVGHSAYETHRMLMSRGVPYRAKNFALGFRAEHEQAAINRAQWGLPRIPGAKAAEYRLTAEAGPGGVYSFCMCPGGTVVPAGAYADVNVVNGKSDYARAGRWANAAVVAGLSLGSLLGREPDAAEALDWLEALERRYKQFSGDYRAPAMTIRDFLRGKSGSALPKTSYPLGLAPAYFTELLPQGLVGPLREGLGVFCRKLRGYEDGIILGLESKTSACIQVARDADTYAAGAENLFFAGEGAGWSGGIVSSAADGLKAARAMARSLGA